MDPPHYSDNWVAPPAELPAAQLAAITIGDAVKISNGRERFFVIVTGCDGNSAAVVGRIDNALVRAAPYGYGDRVLFQRQHAWQVHDAASRCALAAHLSTQIAAATANGVSPRSAVRALMQTARIVD